MNKGVEKNTLLMQMVLICMSFAVNGIMVVLTTSLLTYLMSDLGISYDQAGYLVSIQAFGNLIAGLLSGLLIRKIGRKWSCISFLVAFIVGYSVLLYSKNVFLIYPMIFLSGLGWGLCNNVCHLLVNQKGMKNGSVYVLHTSYAIGAFVAPLILIFCNRLQLGFRSTVWTVVILSAILLVLFATTRMDAHEPMTKESTVASNKAYAFFQDPRFYICFGLYFCYGGAETSINSWMITFFKDQGIMTEELAQAMLSTLWLVIIFARLFQIVLAKKLSPQVLLIAQAAMMMLVIFGMTFNRSTIVAVGIVVLIGIFMAGMTPANAGNAKQYMTGDGLSSGIIFAGNGLGAAVLPALVGVLFAKSGLIAGMMAIVGLMLFFTVLTVINSIVYRKNSKEVAL